jgi:hypothetical protein
MRFPFSTNNSSPISEKQSSFLLKSLAGDWGRRRWLDFRYGHGTYLVFLMTFANFVTIQYGLLVNQVPFLKNLFESVWIFAIMYVIIYVPVAMIIGYWHRKTQWRVEQQALFKENEIGATMWLFVIDLIDGKVSEEEKEQMRGMLNTIVRKPFRSIEVNTKTETKPA